MITVTEETIEKLKDTYDSNKEELISMENDFYANITDEDPEMSFEQGYNNALEYVFKLLGIEYAPKVFDENSNDKAEFKGQIVDIFEDFLDENGYDLKNKDRDAAIEEAADEDELAHIYGEDYDRIADAVESVLRNHENRTILTSSLNRIITAFTDLCSKNNIKLNDDELKFLNFKIKQRFKNWNIILL